MLIDIVYRVGVQSFEKHNQSDNLKCRYFGFLMMFSIIERKYYIGNIIFYISNKHYHNETY